MTTEGRAFVALVVLMLPVLAGCAETQSEEEPAGEPLWVRRVEAEGFMRMSEVCSEGVDMVTGHLYQAWASEGMVVRLPREGCALEFRQDFPVEGRFARFRALGEAEGAQAELRVLVNGTLVAWGSFTPEAAAPAVHALEGVEVPAGRHTLRVEYRAAAGTVPPLQLDYVEFEGRMPDVGEEEEETEVEAGVAAPTPGGGIARAGPLRIEAEDYDRPDQACSPDVAGNYVRREARDDASGGAALILPRSGCGVRFTEYNLPAAGHFTGFRAAMRTYDTDAEMRLRVVVNGDPVATVMMEHVRGRVEDALFEGRFDNPVRVDAGRVELRLDYQVVSGLVYAELAVDYVTFRAG